MNIPIPRDKTRIALWTIREEKLFQAQEHDRAAELLLEKVREEQAKACQCRTDAENLRNAACML